MTIDRGTDGKHDENDRDVPDGDREEAQEKGKTRRLLRVSYTSQVAQPSPDLTERPTPNGDRRLERNDFGDPWGMSRNSAAGSMTRSSTPTNHRYGAAVLDKLGVTATALQEASFRLFGERGPASDAVPSESDEAQRAVSAAVYFAREAGHDYVGTEHLLFVLVSDPGSRSRRLLNDLDVSVADVKRELEGFVRPPKNHRRRRAKAETRTCSFCGKGEGRDIRLVAGPGVWICRECVRLSSEILASRGGGGAVSLAPLSALGDECRRWLRATWPPMVAYVLALFLIATFAGSHDRILIGLAAMALGATSIWFGHTVRRERREANYRVGRARLVVAVAVALLSVVAMCSSPLGRRFEVFAFAGLGMFVVSIGSLVSEGRRYQRWEHVRGPAALGVAFLAISAALVFHPKSGAFVVVVGAGLLLAELGTELYSDDRLRIVPLLNPWWTASLGALAMLVGVGMLVSWGAGATGGFSFAVIVLAVVWMAASDSDSLVIVMVVALALIWASAPRDVVPDPTLEARRDEPYFVVLGDSFTSGEGAQRFYEGTNTSKDSWEHTNTCRRAPTAWPVRLAADTHPAGVPDRMLFLACSGAVSANIRSTPRVGANGRGKRQGPAELEQLVTRRTASRLTEPPAFVLLSVGGNDAGFGTIGKTCVGPGNCAEVGDKFLDALTKVEQRLDATHRDVRAAIGPNVPVITVPYPIPVSDSGACPDVFLSDAERKFVVQFVRELNAVVRSAATRAGSEYMETMETALTLPGKRLCEGPNPSGLNFLSWHPQAGNLWQSLTPTNWTHNSLHPNEDGHEAMRRAAAQWFETHPNLGAGQPSGAAPRTVRPVDQMLKFGTTTLCSVRRQESCALEKNQWLYEEGFRLISSSFLPTVLAMVGAWMIAMAPIRWATKNNVTSATVILRLVRLLRLRGGS